MNGKKLRLARLISPCTKKTCIVPIDHGITLGPIPGICNYLETIKNVVNGGADAIVLHKGILKNIAGIPRLEKGKYILHLSASTILSSDVNNKILVSSVEEALRYGADGVSIHVNLGVSDDAEMIKDFGRIAGECMMWGMPLLVMIYVVKSPKNRTHLSHALRIAEELGADIIKIEYPGNPEEFENVIQYVRVPIVVAGGEKYDNPEKFFVMIDNALNAGAAGVATGRNIFCSDYPGLMTRLVSKLVHGEMKLQECIYQLRHISDAVEEWEGRHIQNVNI